ncbi:hypothetical protein ACJX0J_020228, partial [Zea mays]
MNFDGDDCDTRQDIHKKPSQLWLYKHITGLKIPIDPSLKMRIFNSLNKDEKLEQEPFTKSQPQHNNHALYLVVDVEKWDLEKNESQMNIAHSVRRTHYTSLKKCPFMQDILPYTHLGNFPWVA